MTTVVWVFVIALTVGIGLAVLIASALSYWGHRKTERLAREYRQRRSNS